MEGIASDPNIRLHVKGDVDRESETNYMILRQ